MEANGGARCARCSHYTGLGATFCANCGLALHDPLKTGKDRPGSLGEVHMPASTGKSVVHRLLRLLFTLWLVAYPVISCGPMLVGAATGGSAGGYAALGGVLVGGALLIPWLVGLLVLGLLTRMS